MKWSLSKQLGPRLPRFNPSAEFTEADMSKITIGKPVPNFELPATGGKTVALVDLKGKYVVLYFYPKDNTPGCTLESQDFRDYHAEFATLDTVVLGVSRDSVASHESFKAKQEIPFDLLSDQDEKLCKLFDVIQLKNMYGKQVMGVERSTFLIDKEGVLRREWRKVKVKGHAEAVFQEVKEQVTLDRGVRDFKERY